MQLRTYLAEHRIRQTDFARRLGTSASHLSVILTRGVLPRAKLISAIQRETGGEVTAADMLAAHMELYGDNQKDG